MGAGPDEAVIRLRVPAQEDHVVLLRAAVRVVAGRIGCRDDARSRLQAALGAAFFALLDAGGDDDVLLTVAWDGERVAATVRRGGADGAAAVDRVRTGPEPADGLEVAPGGAGLRLWVAIQDDPG